MPAVVVGAVQQRLPVVSGRFGLDERHDGRADQRHDPTRSGSARCRGPDHEPVAASATRRTSGSAVALEELLQRRRAAARGSTFDLRRGRDERLRRRRRIARVVAGDRVEDQRRVVGRPGHRPTVVERPGERDDAGAADPAIGRLESGDAAVGRRESGCCRRCRCRARRRPARRRRLPPSRRSTRRPYASCPRVAGLAEVGVRVAVGELHHVRLAKDDGAGVFEHADGRRRLVRNRVRQDARAGCRPDSGGREQIFDRQRDAEQRTRSPARRCASARSAAASACSRMMVM